MAREIRISESVQVVNGNFKDSFSPGTVTIDQATAGGGNPGTVSIGTSEEDVSFGDVTPGLVVLQNLDTTNYVEYGPKSGGAMVILGKLAAGKTARFYMQSGVTLRMKANTGACSVLIKGYPV